MLLRHHPASICAIISVAAALVPHRFPQPVAQEITQETAKESTDLLETDYKVVGRAIEECSRTSNKYSCLANKAAIAMERAVNWDIPIFGGLEFAVDEDKIQNVSETTRGFADGVSRLSGAVARFMDTHTLRLDLTGDSGEARDGGGNKKGDKGIGKKERKYLHYALMVLLGVFGISGPLILKTLALIAGKALIASNVALIIVGSVALKKIFEKDQGHASVKVLTHTVHTDDKEEEFDRYINAGAYKFVKTV